MTSRAENWPADDGEDEAGGDAENSIEYLQNRLEELKREKDFKIAELEKQRRLHLQCVERRFEAEKMHLQHQLKSDKSDLKRDFLEQLYKKKKLILLSMVPVRRPKRRRVERLVSEQDAEAIRHACLAGTNGFSSLMRKKFNYKCANDAFGTSAVVREDDAIGDIQECRQPFNPSRAAAALPTDEELINRTQEDRLAHERDALRERQAARRSRYEDVPHQPHSNSFGNGTDMTDDSSLSLNSKNTEGSFGKSVPSSSSKPGTARYNANSNALAWASSSLKLGADGKPLHSEVGLHQGVLYIKGTTYDVDQRVVVSQKHKSFTAVLTELYPTEIKLRLDNGKSSRIFMVHLKSGKSHLGPSPDPPSHPSMAAAGTALPSIGVPPPALNGVQPPPPAIGSNFPYHAALQVRR